MSTRRRSAGDPSADLSELSEEVPPLAGSLAESLRAFSYSLPTAIADLVDNSISAGSKNVWIQFDWDGPNSVVSVADDGGIPSVQIADVMRLGSISPLNEGRPSPEGVKMIHEAAESGREFHQWSEA